MTFTEIRESISKAKRKCAYDIYKILSAERKKESMYEYSKVGISLHAIAHFTNGDMILKVLDKLHLPEGHELVLEFWSNESFGQYELLIKCPNGSKSEYIFDYIYVEESPMGAWQAYLLYKLWHILPLNDHSCYNERKYIFLDQDKQSIKIEDKNPVSELKKCNVRITIDNFDNLYYISSCYWCRFRGLERELVEIEIENNRVRKILDVCQNTLYEYGRNIWL